MIFVLCLVVCGAVCLPAMATNVGSGIHIGQLAERAMVECGMTLKELALTCEYRDASTLCRAFQGQAPLDLWHLRHAPIRWWQLFLAKLASALIVHQFDTLMGDCRMARAEIRDLDTKKERTA